MPMSSLAGIILAGMHFEEEESKIKMNSTNLFNWTSASPSQNKFMREMQNQSRPIPMFLEYLLKTGPDNPNNYNIKLGYRDQFFEYK
ncbi:hypothetical protein YC2023_059521 [Brassica napus]